jgi:hypothetical protein
MRRFLYPLFLLSLLGIIYYFFGSNFSPVVEKLFFVLALIILFFLFRAIFSFVFGFLIDSLSFLVKTLLALAFFLLLLWVIWMLFLPQEAKDKVSDIFTQSGEVAEDLAENIDEEVENILNENNTESGENEENNQDGESEGENKSEENPESSPETTVTISHTLTNESASEDKTEESQESQESEEENSENNNGSESADKNTEEAAVTTWKKPVVKDANDSVADMREAGVVLTSTGPSTQKNIVAFDNVDAQMVFPAEVTLGSIENGKNFNTLETLSFETFSPEKNAQIEVSLKNSGANFEKYFSAFTTSNPDENKFFIAEQSAQSIVYVSFFEGILWEIRITLEKANPSTEDFYNVLLPISFERKD